MKPRSVYLGDHDIRDEPGEQAEGPAAHRNERIFTTRFLIFLAWFGILGAVADSLITAYAAWEVVANKDLGFDLTVDKHLRLHLPFLYWLKELGYALAPNNIIDWIFDLPALFYFPLRVVINLIFGWIMLQWADRLKAAWIRTLVES